MSIFPGLHCHRPRRQWLLRPGRGPRSAGGTRRPACCPAAGGEHLSGQGRWLPGVTTGGFATGSNHPAVVAWEGGMGSVTSLRIPLSTPLEKRKPGGVFWGLCTGQRETWAPPYPPVLALMLLSPQTTSPVLLVLGWGPCCWHVPRVGCRIWTGAFCPGEFGP